MNAQTETTQFAPAKRASLGEIQRQAALFHGLNLLEDFVNSVPALLFIINNERQIVYANELVYETLSIKKKSELLGQRIGEAIGCIHATETSMGCGTTEYCRECGAVKSILISQKGTANEQECRIIRGQGLGALDFKIDCTPLKIQSESFTVFIATDIADRKRKEALQRVFFHDLLNIITGLQGYMELCPEANETERQEFITASHQLVMMLVNEITGQRELMNAEEGGVVTHPVPIQSINFLEDVKKLYEGYATVREMKLVISDNSDNVVVTTDKALLQRIVGNMIKNALEASARNDSITLGCISHNQEVEFWIHNKSFMPRDVQLQIFQRSYSTKGVGRGLGTYSMRLFGEKFLGGKLSFISSMNDGTTFRITLPSAPQKSSTTNNRDESHR
jgi:nitrogen-specific signal transduction histidine kinase